VPTYHARLEVDANLTVIVPNDVFARLSVSQVMSEAKTAALTYRLFDSEAAAQEWLRQLA